MNFAWVIRLTRQDAFSLAPLRLVPSIEIAETQEDIWVRGKAGDDKPGNALQALPAFARFEWLPDGRLRSVESRIPAQSLPSLDWKPIAQWLRVELPSPAPPGQDPARTGVRLVRSGNERRANVLR